MKDESLRSFLKRDWLVIGFVFSVSIYLIFRAWFSLNALSAGDAAFYFRENLEDLFTVPFLWISDGLGYYHVQLFSFPYLSLPLKFFSYWGLPWFLIERLSWYWPFLALCLFSSIYFIKTFSPKIKLAFIGSIVYLLNSYILMIVGGGQISIALAYAIFPLTVSLFIKNTIRRKTISTALLGLVLGLHFTFEPRIALLALLVAFFYALINFRFSILKYLRLFGLPLLIALGLHFYWVLPLILIKKAAYASNFILTEWVDFLSFALFSQSFSLLHPFWPENIFGKTFLMNSEFLIIPCIAFGFLFWKRTDSKNKLTKDLFFFGLLVLGGAFLAKGSSLPLGKLYLWLFEYFPGMNLFRDPTKFYVMVALGYCFLIPFSLDQIVNVVKKKNCFFQHFPWAAFLLFWLFLIRPAWQGQLGGTFKSAQVPTPYMILREYLSDQNNYFRTFWVPKKSRFGFFSNQHPAVSAEKYVTDVVCQEPLCSLKTETPEQWGQACFPNDHCYVREISYFFHPRTKERLQQMAVKYVIIPFDTEGEIFIAEHRYNPQQREEVENLLNTIGWLKKVKVVDQIAVYEVRDYEDHFFVLGDDLPEISWQMVNPTRYKVSIEKANQPFSLIFSEAYDSLWQARVNGKIYSSTNFNQLNSFNIEESGDYMISIEFFPQKYVYYGGLISLLTLLVTGIMLKYSHTKK